MIGVRDVFLLAQKSRLKTDGFEYMVKTLLLSLRALHGIATTTLSACAALRLFE